MKYDFDELVERRVTGCVKWDECPNDEVIPLWVADMDFKAAPAIQDAVRKRAEHGVFGYAVVEDDSMMLLSRGSSVATTGLFIAMRFSIPLVWYLQCQ